MNPNLEDVINSLGVTSEMMWIFFTKARATGFNETQALELTKVFLATTLNSVFNRNLGGSNHDE